MRPETDDLKILAIKYRIMNIEESKASIDNWEEDNDCSNQFQSLDIAKNEQEQKYKDRQEQIELLTQSLCSSSRVGRWISSIRAIFKRFIESKN